MSSAGPVVRVHRVGIITSRGMAAVCAKWMKVLDLVITNFSTDYAEGVQSNGKKLVNLSASC